MNPFQQKDLSEIEKELKELNRQMMNLQNSIWYLEQLKESIISKNYSDLINFSHTNKQHTIQ